MSILITGGAGYIGSHAVKQLLEETKHELIILDNLSTGSQNAIDTLQSIRNFKFVNLDLKEFEKVDTLFKESNIETVLHFAASIIVPESVEKPLKYYMNNTVNTTNLIQCAVKHGVKKFIFSSTAAVYGDPVNIDENGLDEESPTNPINPYGMSKLMSENVLQDTAKVNENFKFVIFRYFNVAGADIHYENGELKPRIGQAFPNATHLIKIASECAVGKREKMYIFGDDYDTSDGTGVRDYIHVDDLAQAHIKAIPFLDNYESNIFNLGYGKGFSVKEVISTVQSISSNDITVEQAPRRSGDSSILIANNNKLTKEYTQFNWKPEFQELELICKSAINWENTRK